MREGAQPLCLDGVTIEQQPGELSFHPLSCLTNSDVADILQVKRAWNHGAMIAATRS